MMCLGVVLSALPGLVCLFHLPNSRSFLSLFFQIRFQNLALSLLLAHDSDAGTFGDVPEAP